MDKIGHGKWGGWIVPLGVLLRLFTVITAQPGFLSISCGGKTDHTAENNITWVTDAGYIDVGQRADIGNASALGSYLHSLRYFPKPLNKSCYQLPVIPNAPYLLRLWFVAGNSSLATQVFDFSFSIETVDILATQKVFSDIPEQIYYEFIFVTSGSVLYICLVRTLSTDDPFISAIELRRLQDGMYQNDIGVAGILVLQSRIDVGGNSVVRYPQDKFDRIWTPSKSSVPSRNIFSKEPISTTNTKNLPPTAVMQTASVILPETQSFFLDRTFESREMLLVLYFAEIETLNMSESRSFHVQLDGVQISDTGRILLNYSAQQVTFSHVTEIKTFELLESTNSMLPPIINAYEYYWDVNNGSLTYSYDIDTLNAIKGRFHIKDWISDPCYSIPWNGISCDYIAGDFRISEIDLSGRKLTGLVPEYIGDLPALLTLSLANNDFIGVIPASIGRLIMLERLSLANNYLAGPIPASIANLIMLERLYLQNNSLNGNIEWLSSLKNLKELYLQNNNFNGNLEWFFLLTNLKKLYLQNNNFNGNLEWLSQLKNLKELNIANNNFSGIIPAQFLLNCSLKLIYSGKPYLGMNKRECSLQNSSKNNSEKNKLKVVFGITVSGIIIITLIVGIVVKFRIKEEGVATERTGVKNEPKHFMYQDYSMPIVPNPTKCRAFTLNDMIVATQSFSREIGRGGFGSVFFGKLPEGQLIAVKVLSSFSRQGIQEFLNEVDLLSKINHRNLVSLLGYCNETKEVMLIYEHMSAGSLRDHLHGPSAKNSELNWKRRLKIALDAAQGLEYLHVGCTPKIIHRDIKSDNILLDTNLNGKLADFGLSKMTMGEATHVTTGVKGTFGYLDPEYYNTQMLTEKSDMYSFGVVLLEIICGRPPIDIILAEEKINIVRWVTPYLLEMDENGGEIIEIIDKRLCGSYDIKSITGVAKVAMRCVQAVPSSRPSVGEVVAELKEAIRHEDKDSISIAEDVGIQNGDLVAVMADWNKREGMEWSDNSSNISKVGR